uniref:Uncharacterized protein n=1 Tax=Daphnia galeata TaxID=27404 RepID=A0A8J2W465_9CRUS|nr:unnamed protein product [Daphnia galeata]
MPRIRGRGRERKHPSVHQPVPNIGGRNLNRDEPIEPSKQLLQLPDQSELKAGGEGAENGEREPAIHQRLFDRHRELIDQDCALIKAHLAIVHQEDIDREKINDQLKQFLEKSKEIEEKTYVFADDIEQTAQEQRRKELELNQREEALNNRETALNKREEEYDNMLVRQRSVKEREKYLHDLEKSLLFRESQLSVKK